MDFLNFLDFSLDFLSFWIVFLVFWIIYKVTKLLKVTEVTTEHQKWPKIGTNSEKSKTEIIAFFKAKKHFKNFLIF